MLIDNVTDGLNSCLRAVPMPVASGSAWSKLRIMHRRQSRYEPLARLWDKSRRKLTSFGTVYLTCRSDVIAETSLILNHQQPKGGRIIENLMKIEGLKS